MNANEFLEDIRSDEWESRINHGNLESNIKFLRKCGVMKEDKKMLEVGSGHGSMLKYLIENDYDIRGLEIREKVIKKSEYIYGELPLHLVDGESIPFGDGEFDIVMSFDVIEHIPNSDEHISEVSRVLREGGYYLFSTPNKYTNTIFETIRHKSFTDWRDEHCSLHSYWDIIDRLEKHNFKVEFVDVPVVNNFFKSKVKRYTGSMGILMLNLINPDRLPIFMRTNFFVKAKN